MGSQSLELVKDLVKFPVFKDLVERAHKILLPHGFSVNDLFYKSNEDTFKDITNVTLTIVIVQVIEISVYKFQLICKKHLFWQT